MSKFLIFIIGIAVGIALLTYLDKTIQDQDDCEANMQEIIIQEGLK